MSKFNLTKNKKCDNNISMFAIIKTGGKQYKVEKGDVLRIEKIDKKTGNIVTFNEVLLVSDDKKKISIGMPKVKEAKVEAKILEQGRAKKVEVVKYKPKIRYKRKKGHRQPYTKIEITAIKLS